MHFAAIGRVPGDPILGLMEAYARDTNPAKFDLGVGVFKDAQGLTPIPAAVKQAEQRLVERQGTKSYVGGHGDAEFGRLVSELVLGSASPLLDSHRAGATQTPGGTGALRLAAEFIAHCLPGRGIWLSDPTWPIHETIFAGAKLKVSHYPYVGADNRLDVAGMLAALAQAPEGDVVLLHACCHNPTGFDLSQDDWRAVLEVVRKRNLLPLIDFAYQGFGDGLEEDAWAVRLFAAQLPELLITSSCSKNFGLYRDRTGALLVCSHDAEKLLDVRSQLALLARNLWSTPGPWRRGGRADPRRSGPQGPLGRRGERHAPAHRRTARGTGQGLGPHGLAERFAHIAAQRGMFSYTGLNPEQVRLLREKHSVYMVGTGRANIAGADAQRLEQLAAAIADVCR